MTGTITLLPHNEAVYPGFREFADTHSRMVLVSATGTGKTYLAMKYAEEKEVKPLVIVPNDFIKSQWKKSPLPCEVITYAGTKGLKAEEIAKKYPMVFCDEAQHIGAPVWGVFTDRLLELAESGACHVIGLTADPVRYTDGGRNVSDRFGKNVFSSYPLEKAIKEGVLPRFRYIGCSFTDSRNPDEKTLTLRKRLDIRANTPVIRNILKKDMPEGNRKAVFFISSKKDIPDTVRLAKTCGFRTVSVCASDRSKDVNRKAVQQFEQGSHTALVAIDMFDEGMHIKGTDTVVLLKRTTSPRVFYQEIGRALESGTKKEIAVFDLVSNLENMKVIDTHSAAECGEKRAEAKSGEQMIADAFSLDCSLVCQKTEAMVRREDRRDMREARRRTVGTGKEKTAAQKRAIREARRRIKKGRTVWSKEELETLRTYYPLEGRACAKRFPGRKPATIAAMAHSRGYICEKNQNRWKKEEEDILLQYWKTDPERVMRETGRTRHACENKAMHCGLNHKDEEIQPCVRSARTPWTYKELDILREYYHMETAAKVAQRIPGRSIHSIRSKAESMGLVPNHKWTREELGILKTYGLDDMDRLVMMLPAHKKYSIQRKAEQLGIA